MTISLDDIRKNVKSGKVKAAKPSTAPAKSAVTAGELDALYAKGSQATNTANSHVHGLRAVYEAGAKGART